MTNKEIYSTFNGLMNLREDATMRLPARTSFAIARDIKLLQPIVEDIAASRLKTLETYGTRSENNPDMFSIEPDKQAVVSQELSALDDIENDINLIKIKLSDLDKVELSIATMDALYPLIEEEV